MNGHLFRHLEDMGGSQDVSESRSIRCSSEATDALTTALQQIDGIIAGKDLLLLSTDLGQHVSRFSVVFIRHHLDVEHYLL